MQNNSINMEKKLVDLVFDRRKNVSKKGFGMLEVRVRLNKNSCKYFSISNCSPDEWEQKGRSFEVLNLMEKCEKILAAMNVLGKELNVENFNHYFYGEKLESTPPQKVEDSSNKNFIVFMEMELDGEELRHGTWKNKKVVIEAVRAFGKMNTYGDLTPKHILEFDTWLHDGTRSDVTIYGYHKKVHQWVRRLYQMDEIPRDPYKQVTLRRGKSKEREPLTEQELKLMREHHFMPKLDRVRDLFIFSAYTGLSFSDTQVFDFESMTKRKGDLFYIDGSRIKTDTKFFTPILEPAMKVLEKYDFKLPHISNQKANDYLHVIEAELKLRHSLTFHVARHSFATMALAHDIPIENVARMLGHEDIKTTQIYAKILRTTIERHSVALQEAIKN